jgi:hypothetical protein
MSSPVRPTFNGFAPFYNSSGIETLESERFRIEDESWGNACEISVEEFFSSFFSLKTDLTDPQTVAEAVEELKKYRSEAESKGYASLVCSELSAMFKYSLIYNTRLKYLTV